MEPLPFDRDLPCPACGIRLEILGVCRETHPDLVPSGGPDAPSEHLHVACPGCGWSAYMRTAAAGMDRVLRVSRRRHVSQRRHP